MLQPYSASALIHVQRDFLLLVFFTLFRNACVFDGPRVGHFLPAAEASQPFFSYRHQNTVESVKVNLGYFHIFPACPLVFLHVYFPTCACHYVFVFYSPGFVHMQ